MSGILESICKAQEAYMTDLRMPGDMADLRPALGRIVAQGREQAPYFTALLSSKHGLTIQIDNREEHVNELTPSAGTVLSAFDGNTIYERAISGFRQDEVQKAADKLVGETRFTNYRPADEPERRGDFVTPMQIDPSDLSIQEKLDRCRELHRRLKGRDSRIANSQVLYLELGEHSVFASQYADLAQRVQRVRLFLFVVVSGDDGHIQYDYTSKSGGAGWEVLDFTDEEIQGLVDSAIALLSAER